MKRIAILIAQPLATLATLRWVAWLRAAWKNATLDADERFLGEAHDFADLEWRLRCLERRRPERLDSLDPAE
jgi:hypothetical protein